MSFPRRIALLAALTLASHAALAQDKTVAKFAASTTWLGQLPVMVAIKQGFFAAHGVDVVYEPIVASSDRLLAVTSGSADFSNLGRTAVLEQLSRGNDSFIWFGNIDQAPGAEGCYAKPGIDGIAALKGKRVAANTSAEYTMSMLLKDNGLGRADIQYYDLPASEMVPALAKGDVDAICVWQPYLSKAAEAVPGGKVIGLDSDTDSYKRTGTVASADILVMSKAFLAAHRKAATGIADAMFEAVDFIDAHPDEAAAIFAGYSKLDLAKVKADMKHFQYISRSKFAANVKGQLVQLTEFAQWLLAQKKIHSMPDIKAALDTSFMKLD